MGPGVNVHTGLVEGSKISSIRTNVYRIGVEYKRCKSGLFTNLGIWDLVSIYTQVWSKKIVKIRPPGVHIHTWGKVEAKSG